MRKLDNRYENPVDVLIYNYFVEPTSDFHNNLGLTPNALTSISLILTLLSIYYIYKKNYILGAIFYFVGYFYDCLDGYNARKFNLVSKFGDLYDHASDIIKIILLYRVLYENNSKLLIKVLPFIIIGSILTVIHMSCQEIIHDKNESDTLTLFNPVCTKGKTHATNVIKYTKYFGSGTYQLLITILILLYDKIKL
jgi:phosphatidylglycerophosphate synthase